MRQKHKTLTGFKKIASSSHLETIFNNIIEVLSQVTDADFGSIFLANAENSLRRVYTTIPLKKRIRSRKKGNTQTAFQENRTIYIPKKTLKEIHPDSKTKDIDDILVIPLADGDSPIGVVTLLSKKNLAHDEQTLDTVGQLASFAVSQINKSLELRSLKSKIRDRDVFVSMASHELNTPLTTITSYAQLALSKKLQKKEVPAKHLEKIITQTERLRQTITDFLSLENVQKSKIDYDFSEMSILDILESLAEEFKIHHPHHKLDLQIKTKDEDIWILGDYENLYRAIGNVLRNAGKYSPENSKVSISLGVKQTTVIITINDQGPGIHETETDKIFNLFYRSKQVRKPGKGIGLFLAKKIITAHQGTIKTLHTLEGTTIAITLPKLD